ncbi:NADPH-dependent codeinone reductase-like protein [Melia azedarach]|uniref:NADPH-dependent codeinone reductase-like protein n=1 Tax=Melia azedarach TaxID=155640 RepID=A0ACC1XIN2_MELAZ|nr:NADPH-dependent codeinone reductase-like protein [Melia azedarach]
MLKTIDSSVAISDLAPMAKTVSIPSVTLGSTGITMPLVGFGTVEYPLCEWFKDAVLHAIKLGYRHFDTASTYPSEQPLGEAITEALRLGLIKSRDELFITSKLWLTDSFPDRVIPALKKSLKNMGLEYLDCYLIHFPVCLIPEATYPVKKEDIRPMDFEGVWAAMEECQKLGLTKTIGVSNFTAKKLERILATAKILPAVNQVEMNPVWQQKKLRQFCEEKGIHFSAFSPLGAVGTDWGHNRVMECEVLKEIAKAKGKSLAQIAIRWVYQQGVSVITKSFNKQRMEENLDIFDWELTPE